MAGNLAYHLQAQAVCAKLACHYYRLDWKLGPSSYIFSLHTQAIKTLQRAICSSYQEQEHPEK